MSLSSSAKVTPSHWTERTHLPERQGCSRFQVQLLLCIDAGRSCPWCQHAPSESFEVPAQFLCPFQHLWDMRFIRRFEQSM